MVEQQLRDRGIRDARVLKAMETVMRHVFVPVEAQAKAYADGPLDIGSGQTISQPYMVAHMTELLELDGTERVLEIGTGSGYQTAIVSLLARTVFSIERHPELAQQARAVLDRLGITNVTIIEGDGTQGAAEHGPFDAILVTAGGPDVPAPLCEQLAIGGRLVCPVGDRETQTLVRVRRTVNGLVREEGVGCKFVPLIGADGWAE